MSANYTLISYNGNYIAERDFNIGLQNRAFRYGDGFFETMHANGATVQFVDSHFSRILIAADLLKLKLPEYFTLSFFKAEVTGLLTRNKLFQAAKVRASFYRGGEGLYMPESNECHVIIETSYLGKGPYEINSNAITLGIYNIPKPETPFSSIKSINAQFFVLAAIFAAEHGYSDALLVNSNGFLIEATSSNIFCVVNKTLLTPSLQSGCVHGVMRKQVIDLAHNLGYQVVDDAWLTEDDLLQMDEVFLTNAVAGLRYVAGYKSKRFYKKECQKIIEALNQKEFPSS